jgi:hypothetical protein
MMLTEDAPIGVRFLDGVYDPACSRIGCCGVDPETIGTLLAAEGYSKAGEVMTDAFATELKRIAEQARRRADFRLASALHSK